MLRSDAPLTAKGVRQAAALRPVMAALPFELVVVSPLTRTIETATAIFGATGPPKRLCALMCERCTMPSDRGTPLSQLRARHPQLSTWQGVDDMPEVSERSIFSA